MSDDERDHPDAPAGPIPFQRPGEPGDGDPPTRVRVKKLRLALILIGVGALAVVSTVFGMMMAVASDLPKLENRQEFKDARNSRIFDRMNRPIGVLTGRENRIILRDEQISTAMKSAIIAVEDQRFYENAGIDIRGIARAFVQDITHKGAVQGGSTITQQFVKNAQATQSKRTLFEKLREAALAYHLTRKWSKEKILTEYLNAIYFGNGAYGIESAARTYFRWAHPGCGTLKNPCAKVLRPGEAALIAGLVASPSRYDPATNPAAADRRRALVLRKMLEQGRLTQREYDAYSIEALPPKDKISPPREDSKEPYFTTWIKQQVVDRFGAGAAFGGGLKIRTTLDLDHQNAAALAIEGRLKGVGPSASLVMIDNDTGEVRAMIGGTDYNTQPFNLATQGQRQPGSAFKPFVLAEALKRGISPTSLWSSKKKIFTVPNTGGKEKFVVNNYEGNYSGTTTLASATAASDNSVFAEVGKTVGPGRIAKLAKRMGIRTPVSKNLAISLGGLKQGVTPLDMAHAYETIAQHGNRITGSLGASEDGPVGLKEVEAPRGDGYRTLKANSTERERVLPRAVADQTSAILQGVVRYGTGTAAALGTEVVAGKTGTTENYGDAWFVGFTEKYTVAVWVGYPDKLTPMETEYRGKPVAGGTYPAEIFHDFMTSILKIDETRAAAEALKNGKPVESTNTLPAAPVPSTTTTTPSTTTPDTKKKEPETKAKEEPTNPEPAPQDDNTPAEPQTEEPASPTSPSDGGGASPPPGT